MQIDFHHAVTYVAARLAGFEHEKAEIVAYAAQYVDDASSSGTVYFENKALYSRISSAHKMIDPRNAQELANHLVWVPFHFLPGNAGRRPDQEDPEDFVEKIICTPRSPIAEEMVRNAIENQNRPYGLHRLGVAMHVYADTWAHQGFAGVLHEVNEVENPVETGDSGVFSTPGDKIRLDIIDDAAPPLGHGRAYVLPDMPFLSWKYDNGSGKEIRRNNTDDFCEAADELCKAMQRYLAKDADAAVSGLADHDKAAVRKLFLTVQEENGEKRHQRWLQAIADGSFGFGPAQVAYAPRGKDSWKHQALGTSFDLAVHTYKDDFLQSNWKLFHDAIQAHRFYVVHDLLPTYGICAA